MNNFEKTKALNAREMADFLKKVSCPQYDLLVGDYSCIACNISVQCEEQWEKYVQQYVEWLEDESEKKNGKICN